MKKYIYIGTVLLALGLPLSLSQRVLQSKAERNEGLSSSVETNVERTAMSASYTQQPVTVSIIQLIANPKEYDEKYVRVIGFARIAFESNGLYLHQDDYKYGITKNALWLEIAKGGRREYLQYDRKYILLEGTFDAKGTGHRGLYSGAISSIKRIEMQAESNLP
jgi:hypothetical protein